MNERNNNSGFLALFLIIFGAMLATICIMSDDAHATGVKEDICHPNNGNGYVHISVDKASSHFNDDGSPKHINKAGQPDVYSINGLCPDEQPTPTEAPSEEPSEEPTETPTPEPTDTPTTDRDVCSNLLGVQLTPPRGAVIRNGECIMPEPEPEPTPPTHHSVGTPTKATGHCVGNTWVVKTTKGTSTTTSYVNGSAKCTTEQTHVVVNEEGM